MPDKPVPIKDHVSDTTTIRRGALINIKSFVANFIGVIFAHEDHFIALDFDMPFTSSTIPDVNNTGTITEYLDNIFSRIPASAKIIVLRGQFLLEAGAQQANKEECVELFHKIERLDSKIHNLSASLSVVIAIFLHVDFLESVQPFHSRTHLYPVLQNPVNFVLQTVTSFRKCGNPS